MVGPQDGGISSEVLKVVHDNGDKEVQHLWGPQGPKGHGESEVHPNTYTQRPSGGGGRLRKGNRKRKKWGDREEGHMLIQGAQAERWRNADGEERKTEIEKDGDRELEREGERSYKIEATPRGPL